MGWTRKNKKAIEFAEAFNGKNYPDVMVDLETLGTDTDCIVISIGAVRFRMGVRDDIKTITQPPRSFYARLDDEEQRQRGRSETPDTLDWWDRQSDEARAVLDVEGEPVASVLSRFSEFCTGAKRVWGNGNMFDNAIMRDLYDDYGREYPVEFWKDLDVRTLTWLWNFLTDWKSKGKRPSFKIGEEHNALDDARRQVLQVQTMLTELKGSKYES
jgi:hypothetical protein